MDLFNLIPIEEEDGRDQTTTEHCAHLEISNGRICNDIPSCMSCGLVIGAYNNPYIRNITHYRELYFQGKIYNVFQLLGDKLKRQAVKFRNLQSKVKKVSPPSGDASSIKLYPVEDSEQAIPITEDDRQCLLLYYDYIDFLRNNESRILPQRNRTRPIYQVYGEHRRIVFEYIVRLYTHLILC